MAAVRKNDISGSTTFRPKVPKGKRLILRPELKIPMCSMKLWIRFSAEKFNFRALSTGNFAKLRPLESAARNGAPVGRSRAPLGTTLQLAGAERHSG